MMRLTFNNFIVLTFLFGSSFANSADTYIGLQYKDVTQDIFCEYGPHLDCQNGLGYRVSFGYKFTRTSSIELGYVDGGKATMRHQTYEDTAQLTLFDAAYVARMDIAERLNLLGRIGLFYGKEKARYTYVSCAPTSGCQTYIGNDAQRFEGATVGIGLEWNNFSVSYDVDTDLFNVASDYGVNSKIIARRIGIGYLFEF